MKIDQLVLDSTDLHVHCGPDAYTERRVDALQLALQACESGMKHVVIKSHQFCTAPLASMINKIVNEPILVGSLVLNASVGGLNPEAVRAASKEGAKIIWMPTISAKASIEARSGKKEHGEKNKFPGISVINKDGILVPKIKEILEIIKAQDLVLATGHLSVPETIAIANESRGRHIKTILTHPLTKGHGQSFTAEQAMELVKKGAFVEFCFNSCMPPMHMSPLEIVNHIKILGADHCLLTTDFGQSFNPTPTEGFRMMLSQMIRFGLSENELETIVKINPYHLLFSNAAVS
jgi:hypothetical protein